MKTYSKGGKLSDVVRLRAHQTTAEWMSIKDFLDKPQDGPFSRAKIIEKTQTPDYKLKSATKKPMYKSPDNLLSKVPMNATVTSGGTIIKPGGSAATTPMNQSWNDDSSQMKSDGIEVMSMSSSTLNLNKIISDSQYVSNNILITKNIFNKALDSFHLTDHCRGFFNKDYVSTLGGVISNNIGIYCIRWRRTGSTAENETKLLVNGLGKLY